ncbi:MAG: hypothetical protein AAF667_06660 [Pseudomonadota bacterium]
MGGIGPQQSQSARCCKMGEFHGSPPLIPQTKFDGGLALEKTLTDLPND